MASEALVDLSYRGLVLGKRVRLQKVGPRSAYVAHDAPMPVGTELVLVVDEGVAIRAEVARVREGDSKDGPAGMWLWADAAEQRARAWWDAHVSADDPRIPEPEGGRVRAEAPAPVSEPAPAAASHDREAAEPPVHAVEMAAPGQSEPQPDQGAQETNVDAGAGVDAGETSQEIVAASLVAAGDVDDQGVGRSSEQSDARAGEQLDEDSDEQGDEDSDEQGDEDAAEDDYAVEIGRAATNAEREYERAATSDLDEEPLELPRAQGRQPRGTQVMTAVEIADVLGMPPVLDGDGLLEAADAAGQQREFRTTTVMSAVEVEEVLAGGEGQAPSEPDVRDGGSAGGKGRKRRSRKRR